MSNGNDVIELLIDSDHDSDGAERGDATDPKPPPTSSSSSSRRSSPTTTSPPPPCLTAATEDANGNGDGNGRPNCFRPPVRRKKRDRSVVDASGAVAATRPRPLSLPPPATTRKHHGGHRGTSTSDRSGKRRRRRSSASSPISIDSTDDEGDTGPSNSPGTAVVAGDRADAASPTSPFRPSSPEEDDGDGGKETALPTGLEFLAGHCWGCKVELHHPSLGPSGRTKTTAQFTARGDGTSSASSPSRIGGGSDPEGAKYEQDGEEEVEICCYAIHEHPVLRNVPVCCVCSERVEAIEDDTLAPSNGADGDGGGDAVVGCCACGITDDDEDDGDEDRQWFLCDSCPRAVCQNCLTQAHGSERPVRDILRQPEGMTWQCCACVPPPLLQDLQRHMEAVLHGGGRDGAGPYQQGLPDALAELQALEDRKDACDRQLEDTSGLERSIRQELVEGRNAAARSPDAAGLETAIDEEVQDELALWRDDMTKHSIRLCDRISILQDFIESTHRYDLKQFYHLDGGGTPSRNTKDEEAPTDADGVPKGGEGEPMWKREADRAVEKRYRDEDHAEERRRKRALRERKRRGESFEEDEDPRYLGEFPEDIEDLGSSAGESEDGRNDRGGGESDQEDDDDRSDDGDRYAQWRQNRYRAQKPAVARAMAEEDRRLKALEGVDRAVRVTVWSKDNDQRERLEWNAALRPARARGKSSARERASSLEKKPPTMADSTVSGKAGADARRPNSWQQKSDADASETEMNASGSSQGPEGGGLRPSASHGNRKTDGESAIFDGSPLILSESPYIAVAPHLGRQLKEHQKEAIRFVFRNSFADLGDQESDANVGGCILAHSMGLGKSFSTVALLHSLMRQPSLFDRSTQRGKIHKVLLVAPVNTLVNWEAEFAKWTRGLNQKITLHNLGDGDKRFREKQIGQWDEMGGVLLTSDAVFRNLSKVKELEESLLSPGPDAVVLDESHTMLKNKNNLVFKALMRVKTTRRICLTGSPFQNNLYEYFRMVSYIRPGLLGTSEFGFQKEYAEPIEAGMASDARQSVKEYADELLVAISRKLQPHVHRRDATVLLADLPSLQQVCLHVKPTKVQRVLYAAYRKVQKSDDAYNNFLKQYSNLRSIHNHPGTLFRCERDTKSPPRASVSNVDKLGDFPAQPDLAKGTVKVKNEGTIGDSVIKPTPKHPKKAGRESPDGEEVIDLISDSEPEEASDFAPVDKSWWKNAVDKLGIETLNDAGSSNKVVLLLHLLYHATSKGEKTVLFTQCLKTLDFLSDILSAEDWSQLVPSLRESFPNRTMGGWQQGRDFVRIDGQVSGVVRGDLINDFDKDDALKLFIISSKAGGMGINLVSASRVVLFDSHFNPTVDLQALFRCYRYGQTRNVFVYRFLVQNTMEEKVYSRAVNKSGLANRVIDQKELRRYFTSAEISSLAEVDDWVECSACKRWRMLPPAANVDVSSLPDEWYCEMMNDHDSQMKLSCEFPEQSKEWYLQYFQTAGENPAENAPPEMPLASPGLAKGFNDLSKADTQHLVERDDILKNLLSVTANDSLVVAKHYFHDALLTEKDADALEKASKASKPSELRSMTSVQADGKSLVQGGIRAKRKLDMKNG